MSKTADSLVQLRDLPKEELNVALGRTQEELFKLRLGTYTNQVISSAQIRGKRREIARLNTLLRGRELGIEKQGQGKKGA